MKIQENVAHVRKKTNTCPVLTANNLTLTPLGASKSVSETRERQKRKRENNNLTEKGESEQLLKATFRYDKGSWSAASHAKDFALLALIANTKIAIFHILIELIFNLKTCPISP